MNNKKIIIYQVLPRLFGNTNNHCKCNGSIQENGCGKLKDFTQKALRAIKKTGATHIWYTGIIEHATQTDYSEYDIRQDHPAIVKGKAGSPYAIKDYYDIDPDLAINVANRMAEFEELVEKTHKEGMKVIIDFVPNHVARQYHSDAKPEEIDDLGACDDTNQAFNTQNNFYYIPNCPFKGQFDLSAGDTTPYYEYPAKATGNNQFIPNPTSNDWYETVKLNYGVNYLDYESRHFHPIPDTWTKMKDILLFWAGKGVDGFRCDMAEMVPVEFWRWVIPQIKRLSQEILFIAEVYNPSEYHNYLYKGQFDYLYDKVGLYDTLRYVTCGYESATAITRCWQNLGEIGPRMLNFMENHDEQRIASDFFAGCGHKGIPAMIVSACMGTNPVMIYFGQEFGERGMDTEGFSGRDGRTSIFDYWSIATIRQWKTNGNFDGKLLDNDALSLQSFYHTLLNRCKKEKAIAQGKFFDLMYVNYTSWRFNEHRQYAFLRKHQDELLLIVVNFDQTPVNIAVNIPAHAFDYLNIKTSDKPLTAKELLSGEIGEYILSPDKAVELSLDTMSGKIIKFTKV